MLCVAIWCNKMHAVIIQCVSIAVLICSFTMVPIHIMLMLGLLVAQVLTSLAQVYVIDTDSDKTLRFDGLGGISGEIGRASCRERV